MTPAKIAVVVAHPDDEAYAFGALLARLGDSAIAISMTRGEKGGTRPDLADVRSAEFRASASQLGAEAHLFSFPDGGCEGELSAGVSALEAFFREQDVQTVFTLYKDGAYGHRDHIAVTEMARAACGERSFLTRVFATGFFARTHRMMQRFAPDVLGAREEDLGVQEPTHRLRVSDAERVQRRRALSEHTSQLPGGNVDRFLQPGLLAALGQYEYYRLEAGELPTALQGELQPCTSFT